jgi:hypothetical protein
MEIPELGEMTVPKMFAARIPHDMRVELIKLMAVEKRKLNTLFLLLVKEGIPLKKKVHEQKNMLIDVPLTGGDKISFARHPLSEGGEYKENPGLVMEISNGFAYAPVFLKITKENAMTIAANLSIFLNEVNI